jgi:rhamnosyltransferase
VVTDPNAGAASSSRPVIAVVTAFNPSAQLVRLCRDLLAQSDGVVVVDDGSTGGSAVEEILAECAALGCVLERSRQNLGIAAALNRGVAAALSITPRPGSIATFDQDSQIAAGYIDALVSAADSAGAANVPVGMVAPERVEGVPQKSRGTRRGIALGAEPIQSGLLLPEQALRRLGPFLESLFIDCVDTEYYMRARTHGLETVVARGTALGHALGAKTAVTVLGRPIVLRGQPLRITLSAPFRYYYLARNRCEMNRRFGRTHPGWAAGQTLLDLRHFLIALALGPSRLTRARVLLAGLADGIRGRGGRIPARVEELARRIRR